MSASQPLHVSRTNPRTALKARIGWLAARNGLSVSGVTRVEPMPDVTGRLSAAIDAGHLEGMPWFNHERARIAGDLHQLHPTARSVISFGLAYWSGPAEPPDDGVVRGRISRYAWGRDYHRVLKRRIAALVADLEAELGETLDVRVLVDTARVAERDLAVRAGLGFFGKNANVLVPGHGSWVMLGELVTELDLEPDRPIDKTCGRCRICIDRCPTGAIVEPYTIHAPSCISYLTIEHRGIIPRELRPRMGNWVYGCDVCQDVCPYTNAAKVVDEREMQPASIENAFPSLHGLLRLTDEQFGERYYGTPVPRTKRRGLARNAAIALGNTGTDADIPVLIETLGAHDEALVRVHAAWALGRIGGAPARRTLDQACRRDPDADVRDECEWSLAESG